MTFNTRSQSQVIGSILLLSLVVTTAGIIGYATLDLTEPTDQPSADLDLNIDSDSDSLTVDHRGGETLSSEELTVLVSDENSDQVRVDADSLTESGDGSLSAGQSVTDTEAVGELQGDLATVTVVHEPSGTIVEKQDIPLVDTGSVSGSDVFSAALTEEDPGVIRDATGIQAMRDNTSGHYVLSEDVEGSIADYLNEDGFEPIGSDGAFTGSFDGNGHEIHNLNVDQTDQDSVGLFDTIGSSGEVTNLTLENTEASGQNYVGTLAGNNSGTIRNVQTIEPQVSGDNYIGGLVGVNTGGTIESSSSFDGDETSSSLSGAELSPLSSNSEPSSTERDAEVSLLSASSAQSSSTGFVNGNNHIGGLVGGNAGTVENSESTVSIEATGSPVGGLVGSNTGGIITDTYATGESSTETDSGANGGLVGHSTNGVIERSYATGNVENGSAVGGLVGRNTNSDIRNSYTQSSIAGSVTTSRRTDVGGLVGVHEDGATIKTSYAAGAVSDVLVGNNGGLVGQTDGTGTVDAAYWDGQSTGQQTLMAFGEDFSGQTGNWVTKSNAQWDEPVGTTGSTLHLTDTGTYETGLGLYDQSFESSAGFVTEFDYYAGDGDGRADGLAFFLVDGSAVDGDSIQAGGTGGSLGYDGISDAYLGVGLDENDDLVRLRAGDADSHNQITSQSPSQAIDGGWRTARVTVVPEADQSTVTVEMSWDDGNSWETVLENEVHSQAPPDELKFGFSAGTGAKTNVHAIGSAEMDYVDSFDATELTTSQAQGRNAATYMEGFNESVWEIDTDPDDYPELGNGQWGPEPLAAFSVSSNPAGPTEQIEFDASDSLNVESYQWEFGDGTTIADGTAEETHTYNQLGEFDVTLTVTGANGGTNVSKQTVTVEQTMDGSGTADDPFEVSSFHQLEDIQYSPDTHYKLTEDITPGTTSEWDSNTNFDPIGDADQPFTGTFDGNGHTIAGLTIDTADDQVGLFGHTGSSATISDVTVSDADVSGGDTVGVLAGVNRGLIEDVSTSGDVDGGDNVGGLVGENIGTIQNSDSSVSVGANTNAGGGLVGLSSGTVTESYATGTIAGGSDATGGLIGKTTGGKVTQSYATGSVTAGTYKGGLVGRNTGSTAIKNSYARGTVTSGSHIGGLVGSNEDSASLTNTYATGSIEGGSTNGLVGTDSGGNNIVDSYWDTQSTGQSGSAGNGALGLTTAQMQGDSAPTYMAFDETLWTTTSGYPELGSGNWASNPVARFSHSPTDAEVNEQITFDGSGSSDTKYYNWDFGDGTTARSMDSSATHSYSSPGPYTVELTSENADGETNTETRTVEAYGYPDASVTASDTLVTEGDTVEFDGSGSSPGDSRAQYSWDFGDGTTVSDGSDAQSHSYSSPGTYTAELTVTNGAGNQSTDTVSVEVAEAPDAQISGPTDLTVNKQYSWDASASEGTSNGYDWNIGSGPTASHTFSSTGSNTVRLTVTNKAGDSDTAELGVDVYQAPNADISGPTKLTVDKQYSWDGSGSSGASSYDWNIGSGSTASHTFSSTGSKTVRLTVTNGAGDSDTTELGVDVYQAPNADISGPTEGEVGETLNFDGRESNGASNGYDWNIGSGSTASTSYSNSGDKTVSLTVTNGAGDSDSTTHSVYILEPAFFDVGITSTNSPVEAGQNLEVTAQIDNTGEATDSQTVDLSINGVGSDSATIDLSGGQSTTYTFSVATSNDDSGTYDAQVSSEDDSASQQVEVLEPANFDVSVAGTNSPASPDSGYVSYRYYEDVPDNVVGAITDGTLVSAGSTDTFTDGLEAGGEHFGFIFDGYIQVPQDGTYTYYLSADDRADLSIGSNRVVSAAYGTSSGSIQLKANKKYPLTVRFVEGVRGDHLGLEYDGPDTSSRQQIPSSQLIPRPVAEGDDLLVTAEIDNTGDVSDSQTVGLDIPGIGSDSTTVDLNGGQSTLETYRVSTSDGDVGTPTATISSEDSSASKQLEVVEPANFDVSIDSTNSPVEAGQNVEVTATIRNTGDELDSQTVDLAIGGVGSDSVTLDLDGGQSTTHTFSVGTDTGDVDTHDATVSSEDNSATDQVEVLQPANFDVQISDTTTPSGFDQTVSMTATIENTGGIEETQTVALSIDGEASSSPTVTLAPGEATTETISTDVNNGDYTASVSSDDDSDSQAVTVGTRPLNADSWTSSGPNSHSVSDTGDNGIELSYDNGDDFSGEWTYEMTAQTDRDITFDWDYDGHHSWHQSSGAVYVSVNGNERQLSTAPGHGAFSDTGMTTLSLNEGDTVRVRVEGSHYDSAYTLRGTVTMTEGNQAFDANSWSSSGDNSHSVSQSGNDVELNYDNGNDYSGEWKYDMTAQNDHDLTFDWDYSGHHSWYQSSGAVYVSVNGNERQLSTAPGDGSFSDSGTATISVNEGDNVQVRIEGSHFDSAETLRGTFTISQGHSAANANLWSSSGDNSHSVSQSTNSVDFSYDNGDDYSGEWTYDMTAREDHDVEFYWEYSGHHSWYQSSGAAYVSVNGNERQLSTAPGNGYFYDTGHTTISVNEGDSVQVRIEGSHFDSAETLRGTFSVRPPLAVSD